MTASRLALLLALVLACGAAQAAPACSGVVFEDRNGNGRRDAGEPGVAGAKISDGVRLVRTDADGGYRLVPGEGRATFLIKPAGYAAPLRVNGLPDYWRAPPGGQGAARAQTCGDFALVPAEPRHEALDVLLFADPQAKSAVDVDYYARDIVAPLGAAMRATGERADLGLSLGDIVDDDPSLYPAINAVTASLGVPWLHVAGNHDLDPGAASDQASLHSFRHAYGPDTFAWEEPQASFVLLDDVVYRPGQSPAYVGGLREDQFAFLEAWLPTLPKQRLLVVGVHIPLFETSADPASPSFRPADRERLFALLDDFPHVLLLSGHSHNQQHVYHAADSGWHGARPLHEYNVGAACGAFWSGVKDAAGIPDTTMSDGTPNGYARLRIGADGGYRLAWHPARLDATADFTPAMALHAPNVLRQGAYPAWGVYANVFMGRDDTRVEYRVDGGEWRPMRRVERPDPRVLAENVRDDEATALRGYDRSPEATPSAHLWRGALPTGLATGEHRVEVRASDPWQGEQQASTTYRLEAAQPGAAGQ